MEGMMRDLYVLVTRDLDEIEFGISEVVDLAADIDAAIEEARQDGYDDGRDAGEEAGYQDALDERPEPQEGRVVEMRISLYRAIYRGDLDAAEDMANLLAMVDIDRDLIWQAKGMERG